MERLCDFRLLGLLHHTTVNRKGIPADAILSAARKDNQLLFQININVIVTLF